MNSLRGLPNTHAAAVHLPTRKAVFAGPVGVNGPRAELTGSDSAKWVDAIRKLEALQSSFVVPAFGSWGDAHILACLRWYLGELRRLVACETLSRSEDARGVFRVGTIRSNAQRGREERLPGAVAADLPRGLVTEIPVA